MGESIPLSPKHGLRPVITTCPNCGKKSNEIALVGNGHVYTCRECGRGMLSYKRPAQCDRCKCSSFDVKPFDEKMSVAGGLCEECEKEHEAHAEIVKQGGVYWHCIDCGRSGVVKPNEFAACVREACKVPAPAPCGVEFSKTSDPACPACGSDGGSDGR